MGVDMSKIKRQIDWIVEATKLNMKAMFEYRSAFMMQVIGMMINNTAFVLVWYLFFKIFTNVNGWEFKEMIAINGLVAMVYGLVFSFAHGTRQISRYITYGQLDRYLVWPKNVLLGVILSEVSISAVGDLFFGLVSLLVYFIMSGFGWPQLFLMPILLFLAVTIFVSFLIVSQSVAFWIPNSEELSSALFEFLLGPSLYPNSSYVGAVRLFFTFVVPSLFISGVPINILLKPNWQMVLFMLVVACFWLILSIKVFKLGLKRYESGNLVGIK